MSEMIGEKKKKNSDPYIPVDIQNQPEQLQQPENWLPEQMDLQKLIESYWTITIFLNKLDNWIRFKIQGKWLVDTSVYIRKN